MVEYRTVPRGIWSGGALARERPAMQLIGKNDNDLCKSANTFTVCCTVSHLLFWTAKQEEYKCALDSATSKKSRDGGTGRRSGLKSERCFSSKSKKQKGLRSGLADAGDFYNLSACIGTGYPDCPDSRKPPHGWQSKPTKFPSAGP